MHELTKAKAFHSMIWNAIERFLILGGHFIIGIVLARILSPKDFGLIGMLSVFISLSQVFIISGMGSGLIQKQNRSVADFSTVFIFNLFVSLLLYLLLFIAAPYIASFYKMPQLVSLARILGLVLVINSLAIVQRSKLEIALNFKTLTKINVLAFFIGGVLAIIAAINDFAVWSLVIQTISTSLITVVGLWWTNRSDSFSLVFSKKSFEALFGYGSKLLVAGLYAQSLQEIYNLVIGKIYSASDLGYFTQSKKITDFSSGSITSVLQTVTFPILSSFQQDENKMLSVYRKIIKMAAFLTFPLMTLLAILAQPLISLLLSDKWIPVVPLLQWFCFARIITPISAINMNILNAVGRSDLFLKMDLSKFPIIIISLLMTIPLGLKAIVIGQTISSFLAFFINAYMPGKLFGYGAFKQLKEMIPVVVATGFMAFFVYLSTYWINSYVLKMLIGSIIGIISYLLLCKLFNIHELKEIYNILQNLRINRKD